MLLSFSSFHKDKDSSSGRLKRNSAILLGRRSCFLQSWLNNVGGKEKNCPIVMESNEARRMRQRRGIMTDKDATEPQRVGTWRRKHLVCYVRTHLLSLFHTHTETHLRAHRTHTLRDIRYNVWEKRESKRERRSERRKEKLREGERRRVKERE